MHPRQVSADPRGITNVAARSKRRHRAAARGAAHKESGNGALRRGSYSIDLPGETASERFIAPKPRKVPESSEDSSGHGYDVDERELEIQPPAPAIQARENGDSQTNGAAPESGFLNSFASSLVQREEEMAAAMTELSQKVEQLEDRAANQRELLARQESEIRGLQAELERLRIEIGEMSTYAPAAAFSPVSEPPNAFAVSPADLEEEAEAADEQYDEDLPAELEENTSPWESNGDENPPSQTADEFLSPFLIECITTELANAMNVMEYLASLLVRRRVKAMGDEITGAYPQGDEVLVLGLLKGSFIFLADLVRHIARPVQVDFLVASSYGSGTVSSGDVKLVYDPDAEISGRHLLLVEDIVDSGNTMNRLIPMLERRGPKSLEIVALLHKHIAPNLVKEPRWVGFDAPQEFLIGYGLDHSEKYRNLPFIASL